MCRAFCFIWILLALTACGESSDLDGPVSDGAGTGDDSAQVGSGGSAGDAGNGDTDTGGDSGTGGDSDSGGGTDSGGGSGPGGGSGTGGECDACGKCDADPTNDCMQGIEYYGTNVPSFLTPAPQDYELFDTDVSFSGGIDGINHEPTAAQGAGKFVFNRIYRASKHGQNRGEQFGVFHWWLQSYGNNSIEGGVWVNAKTAGAHYYPTLHLAGIGDAYHRCNDVGFGSGLYDVYLGDKWRTMIQVANRVLYIPGVNIAFDKEQPPYEADNGIWIGWGWTYLNLDHPRGYKYWLSFIESYDYQGPIVGYIPEHFNFIDPAKVADGSFQARRDSQFPFGTFATLGSNRDWGIANEMYSAGLQLNDDVYYVPMPPVPSHKDREYVVANFQSIEQDVMEAYSSALKANDTLDSLIETTFLRFTGTHSSTHSRLKIHEQIGGEEHLTVVEAPYDIGHDTYNGYVEWETSNPVTEQARQEQNGFLYYRKLSEKWPVEAGASDTLKNHPHIYRGELIGPPDEVRRVPRFQANFNNYKERNGSHPDFATWDTGATTRHQVLLQNGSTATYVWVKFSEQPAFRAAQQNWPEVYTDEYLALLQTYIEALHRKTAQESTVNPSDPVFINYRNTDNTNHFNPHLAQIDPAQLVEPPEGFEVGYVPVVISVYHPDEFSSSGTGLVNQPDTQCSNAAWTDTYFPDIP